MSQSVVAGLVVTLLLVGPAAAQQQEVTLGVDVKSILSGRLPARSTVTQQGPFTVVSIPISEDRLPMLRAMAGFGLEDEEVDSASGAISLSKVYPLAVGASILTPLLNNGIGTNDVAPLEFTGYYYYWVSANFSDTVLTKATKFALKGPGNGFVFEGPVDYDAASLLLLWVLEDPAMIPGVYKLDVKVFGRPKVKGYVCIGCTSTSTPGNASTITILGQAGAQSFTPNPAPAGGQRVVWANNDGVTHRIVANDGSFDTGNIAPGATSGTVRPLATGSNYHCSIHPATMFGAINAAGGTAPPCTGIYCEATGG